ncbi:MAG: T9SS type A sorting domain-containing protein [Chitinophagaceae bacterium]|nr:T9SS type A sorting domain-containing protein [Chitinophagaceae bacterium]
MKKIYALILLALAFNYSNAQSYQVEMVSDLNPSTGSNPRWLTVCDSSLYFFANDGINGHKIFSVTGNTTPVLCPNVAGAAVFGDGAVSTNRPMGVYNNQLYIPILALAIGRELYKYDAVNIPVIVMDINPGAGSAAPMYIMTYNNKLYFQANSPATGTELWVHDPVLNTTQCLSDINPGANSSTIAFITEYNGKLYFAGSNGNDTTAGNTGLELYSYDPAINAVNLVADINPGYLPSNPTGLMVANNKLYFVAAEPSYGKELYEFDGVNITRLTDVNPGPAQGIYTSDQAFPTWYNGCVYFCANEANNDMNLGEYNTQTNTTNIIYCAGAGVSGLPTYFKVWDNKLFFANHSASSGTELWVKDSNNAPYQVWDINPGLPPGNPKFFTEFNGSLYFNAFNDTSSAEELFRMYKRVDTIIITPNELTDLKKQISMRVSPNPVSTQLTIDITIAATTSIYCELTDITGRKLLETGIQKVQTHRVETIDCTTLPAGSYWLLLKDTNHRVLRSEKVIKH